MRLLSFLVLTAACSADYNLQGAPQPSEEPRDTALVEDTAWLDTDTGEPVVVEEEPAEEEEEEVPYEDDPPDEDDCDHTSDLVYVVDREEEALYLYSPLDHSFELVGPLRCGGHGTPGSMGVSRDGYAYVRYSDDTVQQVDLTTLDCNSTSYSDRATDFGSFGMGYATDDGDTWRDQLYIANSTWLAVVDTATWTVDVLGRMSSQSELTGNAAGELWAILPLETPAELVRLDKETGAEAEVLQLRGFPSPSNIDAFAFATWGGNFYIFVRTYGMGSTTDVYEVTSDGTMTLVLEDSGMDVVGAGVSTCAPTE